MRESCVRSFLPSFVRSFVPSAPRSIVDDGRPVVVLGDSCCSGRRSRSSETIVSPGRLVRLVERGREKTRRGGAEGGGGGGKGGREGGRRDSSPRSAGLERKGSASSGFHPRFFHRVTSAREIRFAAFDPGEPTLSRSMTSRRAASRC